MLVCSHGRLGLTHSTRRRRRMAADQDARNRRGFVATQLATNNAIKVLKYRLETPENLGPNSPAYHYNTQNGGNVEYFTVTVSDQGYTSSTEQARVVEERVDITVVAVNNPPVLTSPPDFQGVEDTMVDILGISVKDPDVAEIITSKLAHLVRGWGRGQGPVSPIKPSVPADKNERAIRVHSCRRVTPLLHTSQTRHTRCRHGLV